MLRISCIIIAALALLFSLPSPVWADSNSALNSGDTSFILISAALVMVMTPGLGLFYGGLTRKKNVLNIIMYSFIALGIITVQWVLFGYSLAFGPDVHHIIGSLDWSFLKGVGTAPNPDYAPTIPHQTFMIFQMMFAIITPAIISGSIAERTRFGPYCLLLLLWATLVYDPVAHWVWGVDGWLRNLGALDFAGGTVVHIISGVSGLVAALVLGRRSGYGTRPIVPHSIPMTMLGASLLWLGWFAFNAGSALSAGESANIAFVNTHIAASCAVLSWVIIEKIMAQKATLLGAVSGAIAGLVIITPAAGLVSPISAMIMGLIVSPVCYLAITKLKARLGYDDSLDAFGIHGVGGTLGALATGVFATTGWLGGNPGQVLIQLVGVLASWAIAAIGTFIILKLIGLFMPIAASEEEQESGLDVSLHGEQAYSDI